MTDHRVMVVALVAVLMLLLSPTEGARAPSRVAACSNTIALIAWASSGVWDLMNEREKERRRSLARVLPLGARPLVFHEVDGC